jgi:hypothetical protein
VAALTQMLAGAVGSEDLARGIWDALEPWTTLVRETIERMLAGTPYGDALSPDDLTAAVTALFLGIELLTGLDPNGRERTLFPTMEAAAAGIDALLRPQAAATDG